MHVWAFTVAMFLGLVMWEADVLDTNNTAGGGDQTFIVGGDDGTVKAMEDPLWPPKP